MNEIKPGGEKAALDGLDWIFIIFMTAFTSALLVVAYWSISWEVHWDAMWLHRIAYLIFERDYAPYRDIFDPNMYGSFILHGMVGAIGGYNDISLRIFDLLWLGLMCLCMFRILCVHFDWRCAWFAPIAYAWIYLNQDETQCIQREHLMVLPLLAALWVAGTPLLAGKPPWLRPFFIGILYGLGASIKPHCVVSLPVLAIINFDAAHSGGSILDWFRLRRPKEALIAGISAIAGFMIPLALGFAWLYQMGSLGDFWVMVYEYWPLHRKLALVNGTMYPTQQLPSLGERFGGFIRFQNFGNHELLFAGVALALLTGYRYFKESRPHRLAATAICLCVCAHVAGLIFIGIYHPYSWMPILCFLCMLHSLTFWRASKPGSKLIQVVIYLASILAYAHGSVHINVSTRLQWSGLPPKTYWSRQVDGIMACLKARLRPDDKVQPFDILGGSDRALTLLGADNGTFLACEHFLNFHVRNPAVIRIRDRFWLELTRNKPRLIVIVNQLRLYSLDPQDDGEYSEKINKWLSENYNKACQADGFVVLERKPEE